MAWTKFNMNECVRVKFRDGALEYIQKCHDELFSQCSKEQRDKFGPIIPDADENGWRKYQLWVFIQQFGPSIKLGANSLIETEIEFEVRNQNDQ